MPSPSESAPVEVKLAIDLIYLLECNQVSPDIVLAALDIVRKDYQTKLCQNSNIVESSSQAVCENK